MTTLLEVPVPPGWHRIPEAKLDPPHVAVEFRWEYKEVIREIADGIMSEAELNALGAERWELVGILPVGSRIHFYFKRERGL
jgi:hypothetical protein